MKNMKKIIYLITLILSFSLYPKTIVFLQGTSRSGKSSICDAIDHFPTWHAIGSVYFSFCLEAFGKLFPQEMKFIYTGIEPQNIRHAIASDFIIFKEDLDNTTRMAITKAIQTIRTYFDEPTRYAQHKKEFSQCTLSEIQKCLEHRKNLVADVSWYVNPETIRTLYPHATLHTALLYCPLPEIIERLVLRNKQSLESGIIMNYRFFAEPLLSFTGLYTLSTDPSGAIDSITKSTLISCFDFIEAHLPKHTYIPTSSRFMLQELSLEQLDSYRQTLLAAFKENDVAYVVPKIPYDFLIRTSHKSCLECTQEIIKHTSVA